jgi:PAS domain S-box-containing protein
MRDMTPSDDQPTDPLVNILLVDDQPANLLALEAILGDLGQNLVKACSGEEALRHLLAADFAVVLLDIHMEGLDGFETARLIRGRERSRHTPIIFLTAYESPDLPAVRAYSLGAVDYLVKPLVPEILRAKVAGFVELSQKTEQVKRQAEQIRQLERRQAEEELRVSRERMELVVQATGLGLWYCDLPFAKLDWNVKCKEHFGLPPDAEVTISRFFDLLHPDDRERTRRAIDRSLADHGGFDTEYRTVAPDGQVRWIRAIGRGFYDTAGTAVRFDGITVDVTGQKQAEEQLKEADRRKDEFLAMLAHELRNPLAPILTGLHLARQTNTDPRSRDQALEMTERQSRHLARLVDDLLEVSRLTQGRVRLRPERLDLARLVRTAAEDRRATLERAGLTLTVGAPETPLWVRGDSARLVQVFSNLLDNGAKFTDRGGQVDVWAGVDSSRRQAVVTVRDSGMGIEPDMLPRLFEPFSQADRSLDRPRGGLGLGLSVVKGLVDLHQGEVQAASAGPGRGAAFTVRLPLEPEPAALSEMPPQTQPAARKVRVLVIEDNHDAADTLRLLLELLGHEVRVAYTGPEGVAMATAWRPEIVLSDIGLPGLNGFEVARRLRQQPGLEKTMLVALTGYGQDEDRRQSKEAGFDYHLVKPADPTVLRRVLATCKNGSGKP